MGISVTALCHYIFGSEKAKDTCGDEEGELFWPNVEEINSGLFTILRLVYSTELPYLPTLIRHLNHSNR